MTRDELLEYKARLIRDVSKYKNLQLAKKVQLNSAYGALGNEYFRFFDIRQAEAITKSGQLSIRWIEHRINEFLNKRLGTENEDFILAVDTDSVYICLQKFIKSSTDRNKTIDLLDKIGKDILTPFIAKSYAELASVMSAFQQKMVMKREVIADKGIWTAKKRYILNVHDTEGVRHNTPKLKMMGIETVRSSTPGACRDALKETIKCIMTGDQVATQRYIADFKIKFSQMNFEDVAFPRSVSDLDKYYSESGFVSATPIHVRGAILYNRMLAELGLQQKYEVVKTGEKIKFCYLRMPNAIQNNVIASIGPLPKEFDLDDSIDYDLQFEKTFLEPISKILTTIGWSAERKAVLF